MKSELKNETVKAVIFDIDGTLTKENSWREITRLLGASSEEHSRLFDAFQNGSISELYGRKALLELWKKTGRARRDTIKNIFESMEFYGGVQDTVRYLHKQGFVLCSITGAIDLCAEVIAGRLDISHWYANVQTIWDQDEYIENLSYLYDQGGRKLRNFKKFCKLQNLSPEQCVAIGDGDNDIELFKYTGRGIAVRSGENRESLQRIAWRVVGEFDEIRKIL